MATRAELEYLVSVQDAQLAKLQREIRSTNKALGQDTSDASDRGVKGLAKLDKQMRGLRVAGVALFGALGVAAKFGFGEIAEGEKVAAQTVASLKSTGGAAKVTQKEIERLAGAVSRKTGIDDEAVQAGQNLLLTFTGIRNEVGKGNKIFDQSTAIMADMSVALGQDMSSSAMQLGKALNNPAKGLTALQRVGVTFTEQQKKQIKSMVKAGDTMGAQKIILAELRREFGGSAEAAGSTFSGRMNKLRNSLEAAAASMVGFLLPALEKVGGWLGKAAGFIERNEGAAKALTIGVAAIATALVSVSTVSKVATATMAAYSTATTVATFVAARMTGTQIALNAAMRANVIGVVVTAIAALGAGLVIAWKQSETFRGIVTGGLGAVKSAAMAVAGFFTEKIPAAFQSVKDWAAGNWPEIATFISGPFAPLVALATDAFGVRSALIGAFGWLKGAAGSAAGAVSSAIKRGFLAVVWDFPKLLFDRVISPMVSFVSSVVNKAMALSHAVPRGIRAAVWSIGGFFREKIIDPLASLIDGAVARGGDIARAIARGIRDGVSSATGAVVGAFKGFLNGIIDVFNKIPFVPNIPRFAEGAVVRGPTMALVGEDGPEVVIPLGKKRRKRGQELLTVAAKILGLEGDYAGPFVTPGSAGRIPMFANGGFVVPGAGNRSAYVNFQIASLRAAAKDDGGILKKIASWGAKGLAKLIDSLPDLPNIPGDKLGMVRSFSRGAKDSAAQALRDLFKRKEEWSPEGIIQAFDWAAAQMGKPYVWGGGHGAWNYNLRGYDCSGFASHAAKKAGAALGSPGTTMTLFPGSRPGSNLFTFGFRGMSSSDPRRQHMGARILGQWFQFGDPGRSGGSDGQWDSLRVPPGLPGYRMGTSYVPTTGPAILHQGEAVLTAEENRRRMGGATVHVDQVIVRDEFDIERISAALSRKLILGGAV